MRILLILLAAGLLLMLIGCVAFQRKLLFFPTHETAVPAVLKPWNYQQAVIGFRRVVTAPKNVWLMVHGNAGQAADRAYALGSFAPDDAVFILEYPGYGERAGTPSRDAFNRAALQAYEILRAEFSDRPVCVVGESIGSGPACYLASLPKPPDKVVLITPFDQLANVAADHFPLPAKWLVRDNWNNVTALAGYSGPLEIFAAADDEVIPMAHARVLAASKPLARFHEISGGHNDWSQGSKVSLHNP